MKFSEKTGKVHKTVATITAGIALYEKAKMYYESYNVKDEFFLRIASNENIFFDVSEWVLSQIDLSSHKNVILSAPNHNGKRTLVVKLPNDEEKSFTLDGYTIQCKFTDGATEKAESWSNSLLKKVPEIVFRSTDMGGRNAIINQIEKITAAYNLKTAPPYLKMPESSHWEPTLELPPRELDSVILGNGQMESLIIDLERFLADRKRYESLGIPYHRGYLFYGPPGTGKTSLAKALGRHFGKNICYLSLGDLTKDSTLLNLICNAGSNILLLEDIDVFSAATSREKTKDTVSLNALLNALDGMTTPHGLITIMTTNHEEKLDPALIRSGRIDFKMKIDYARSEQVERLYEKFYEKRMTMKDEIFDLNISMSDIAEILKVNKDPEEAKVAICKFIEERRNNG